MSGCNLVITGGTGFVGSHLLPRLSADGHRITVLSRNREYHRGLSVLPGVRVRSVDIYDDPALRQALEGADAVINLVGILNPVDGYSFRRTHVELVRRLITACKSVQVRQLHHISSLKAGQGLSQYLETRGQAERLIKASSLRWTIYQPSVIFGEYDGLITRFNRLLRRTPVLPLARADARMAPTWVGDVVTAIAHSVLNEHETRRQCYELYGPEVLTLGQIVRSIRDAAGLRTLVVPLPDRLGRLQARLAGWLPGKPFSPDNFLSLLTDSVGTGEGYAALGISPQPFKPWLPTLLQRRRRQDQTGQRHRHGRPYLTP